MQASNLDILKKTQGGKNSKLKKKNSITQVKNSRFRQILKTKKQQKIFEMETKIDHISPNL